MGKIVITIHTDNAAFEEDYVGEVQRVLAKVYPTDGCPVIDSNGNTVGEVRIYEGVEA